MNVAKLKLQLMRHEAVRYKPYRCSAGKLTIGVGRNLDDVGLSEAEVGVLLSNDIESVLLECNDLKYWQSLSPIRQQVIANMIFNLGITRFRKFKNLERALLKSCYAVAAIEMLDSRWAKQVGSRATELAFMMECNRVKITRR